MSKRRRAEAELSRTRAAYDAALSESGVILFNQVAPGHDGHHVSPSMGTILGWEPTAFTAAGTLRALVHPDDLPALAAVLPPSGMPNPFGIESNGPLIDLTESGTPAPAPVLVPDPVVRFRGADGKWHHLQVRVTATAAHGGARGSLFDVTVEEHARITERRMFELVDRSPAASMVMEFTDPSDPDTLVLRAGNRSARRMLNLERRAVNGTPLSDLFGHATCQLIRSALFDVAHTGQTLTAERLTLAELPSTHLDLRVDRLSDGTLGVTITDVTHTVAIEDRLRHQASHDALTGLPNRALFEERVASVMTAADARGTVALVLVDIDQLREVNESLGLLVGDQLIVEIAQRITRDIQGLAVVSRVGGDEFGV
ncbi:MAG: diguanylate cyclase domain-containing protein, partial [Actinomycetes bacterium]